MSDLPQQYRIVIPDEYGGEVMGKLSAIGATLEKLDRENNLLIISISSTPDLLDDFDRWLSKVTVGYGSIQKK